MRPGGLAHNCLAECAVSARNVLGVSVGTFGWEGIFCTKYEPCAALRTRYGWQIVGMAGQRGRHSHRADGGRGGGRTDGCADGGREPRREGGRAEGGGRRTGFAGQQVGSVKGYSAVFYFFRPRYGVDRAEGLTFSFWSNVMPCWRFNIKGAVVPLIYRALLTPNAPHPEAFTSPTAALRWDEGAEIPARHRRGAASSRL